MGNQPADFANIVYILSLPPLLLLALSSFWLSITNPSLFVLVPLEVNWCVVFHVLLAGI